LDNGLFKTEFVEVQLVFLIGVESNRSADLTVMKNLCTTDTDGVAITSFTKRTSFFARDLFATEAAFDHNVSLERETNGPN